MVRICCVVGCKSGSYADREAAKGQRSKVKSLFRAPKCKKLVEKWGVALKQNVGSKDYVCELHFSDKDIIKSIDFHSANGEVQVIPRQRWRLRPIAVPFTSGEINNGYALADELHTTKCLKYETEESIEEVETVEDDCSPVHMICGEDEKFTFNDLKEHIKNMPWPEMCTWTEANHEIILSFIDSNPVNLIYKLKMQVKISSDLSATMSTCDGEVQINLSPIKSTDDFSEMLKKMHDVRICVGPGQQNVRRSSQCEGTISRYECQQIIRCNFCRQLCGSFIKTQVINL